MFPFTLRQLELFSSLCRTTSFRATADEFRISQPSVSNQISALETQIGLQLLVRERGSPPRLTTDGAQFYQDVETFLESGRHLARRRVEKANKPPTRVKVYVGPVIFNRNIKQNLAAFYSENADLNLEIAHDRPRSKVIHDLQRNRFDIATFFHWEELTRPNIEIIADSPAGIFAHKDLAGADLNAQLISQLPFILPPKDSIEESTVLSWLDQYGITPQNISARAVDYEVTAHLMLQERCACYMNASAFGPNVLERATLIFPMGKWYCHFYAAPQVDRTIVDRLRSFFRRCLNTSEER